MSKTIYTFLYKTINLVNNKYYYGKHSTANINDEYLGSGKALLRAIKKYGKENFIRKILVFGDENYIFELEETIVDKHYLLEECYNITKGGKGFKIGHTTNNGRKRSQEYCQNISNLSRKRVLEGTHNFQNQKKESIQKSAKTRTGIPRPQTVRDKISKALKGRPLREEHKNKLKVPKTLSAQKRALLADSARNNLHNKIKCKFCDFVSNPGNVKKHEMRSHNEIR